MPLRTTMIEPPSAHRCLALLVAAAILGIAADAFFHDQNLGLNLPLWIAGVAAWSTYLVRSHGDAAPGTSWWQLPAVAFAACFAIRDNEFLLFLNLCAIMLALSLPFLARGLAPWRAHLSDFVGAGVTLALHGLTGGARLAFETPWSEISGGHGRRTRRILAGALVAGIVVLVFGSFFASADPLFAEVATSVFSFDLIPLIRHTMFAGFVGVLAAGYLRGRLGDAAPAPVNIGLPAPKADSLIVLMGLGAMAGTFTLFVAIQARYLFGGAAFVQQATGLTLAEYARAGFFECVAACALALPTLLVCDWITDPADSRALRSVRALAHVQLGLIAAVGVSALARMQLYAASYGLSEERIYAAALLVWMVGVSGWFAVTVLRGARHRFAWGAVAGGFATLGGLNVMNPDATIARYNMTHVAAGRGLDVKYLGRLSADAAPALVAHLPALRADEACVIVTSLRSRSWTVPGDWRSANLGRFRARRATATLSECASTKSPSATVIPAEGRPSAARP